MPILVPYSPCKLFFTDYTDENPDSLTITNGLFNGDRIVKETPYMKDVSKYQRCKIIELTVAEADGIYIDSTSHGNWGKCLKSFEILDNVVQDIKRFYELSGEDVNYTINMSCNELVVTFITMGDKIKPEESHAGKIDTYLLELKNILKDKYKRIKITGNWLEVRTPKTGPNRGFMGDYSFYLSEFLRNVRNNVYTIDNTEENDRPSTKYRLALINWKNKISNDGFIMDISGGDHQSIVQLKKQI